MSRARTLIIEAYPGYPAWRQRPVPASSPMLDPNQVEIERLQARLKQLDPNGWETLEDDERNDPEILRRAIADQQEPG